MTLVPDVPLDIDLANPAAWPSRPEDLPTGSEIAVLHARRQLRTDLHLDATVVLRRLEAQLAGYQTVVRNAPPTSDMLAVAAALAGIQVCERAHGPARADVDSAAADRLNAEQAFDRAWVEYRAAVRELGRLCEYRYVSPSDQAPHVATLLRLAGPGQLP